MGCFSSTCLEDCTSGAAQRSLVIVNFASVVGVKALYIRYMELEEGRFRFCLRCLCLWLKKGSGLRTLVPVLNRLWQTVFPYYYYLFSRKQLKLLWLRGLPILASNSRGACVDGSSLGKITSKYDNSINSVCYRAATYVTDATLAPLLESVEYWE